MIGWFKKKLGIVSPSSHQLLTMGGQEHRPLVVEFDMTDDLEIAQELYEAWAAEVRAVRGIQTARWEDLDDELRETWRAVEREAMVIYGVV